MKIDFRFVSYNRHSATLLKLHVIGIIHMNCIHHVHCIVNHYISLHLNLKRNIYFYIAMEIRGWKYCGLIFQPSVCPEKIQLTLKDACSAVFCQTLKSQNDLN